MRAAFVVSTTVFLFGMAQACSAAELGDSISRVCQKTLLQMRPGDSVKTAEILAPNNRHVAWTNATWEQTSGLFRTAVIVRDKIAGTSETVFSTRTNQAGEIVRPTGKGSGKANADQFCVIDWSGDGRHLLVREIIGTTESHITTDATVWVYDLQTKRRSMIPLSPLRRAITGHWTRKGAKFRDVVYVVRADGWEDSDAPRPAFIAEILEGPPTNFPPGFDGFLGVWSVTFSGATPTLLTENRNANVVRRYGEVTSKDP